MFPLAVANFASPLFWGVFIGWILSVTLHELGHGVVGYLGGDYTIRQRGGLTLNPLQYIDPLNSLIFPAIVMMIGGVPLPGGVTFVRRDLLRNRAWTSLVALAGPVVNLVLFVLCALPFHPKLGWIHPGWNISAATTAQEFLGAMAMLQLLTVFLNLIPIPPLDGFQAIAPLTMSEQAERKLLVPPASTIGFFVYFFVLWQVHGVIQLIYTAEGRLLEAMGFDVVTMDFMRRSFNQALFGSSD